MGVGRRFRAKPLRRPKKSPSARRRRENTHRKRLIAKGVPAEQVRHMTHKAVRDMLVHPKKRASG